MRCEFPFKGKWKEPEPLTHGESVMVSRWEAACSENCAQMGRSAVLKSSAALQQGFLFDLLFLIALKSGSHFILKLWSYPVLQGFWWHWKTTQSCHSLSELAKCPFPKQLLHRKYCEGRHSCSDGDSSIIQKETKLKWKLIECLSFFCCFFYFYFFLPLKPCVLKQIVLSHGSKCSDLN